MGRGSTLIAGILPLVWLVGACIGSDRIDDTQCVALESAWSPEDVGVPASCPVPPVPRDLSVHDKIAVSVFHFNIQYVAGGMRGWGGYGPQWDEAGIEDLIVREGLEPVLDLYLDNPDFATDIELQAYMVEVIAARHPEVLQKMRTLAARGQVAFDSFHYSDQLYIAYPRQDLEVSLDLTEAVFAAACLPLGRSVFTQEGQFARGQLPLAAARGYTASVLPRNLYKYQFGTAAATRGYFADASAPDHGVLIGGRSFASLDADGRLLQLSWTFMDDGEIALTEDKLNPYFAEIYRVDPDRVAERVARLRGLIDQGYVLATIEEAVAALRSRGVAPETLPAVIDGTWQPKDTNNVFRWMGGAGLFFGDERDSEVLSTIWSVGRRVRATALLGLRHPSAQRGLTAAWRELLLAQVSDATGWNPFWGEVQYGFDHAAAAAALLVDVEGCEHTAIELPQWSCGNPAPVDASVTAVAVTSPGRSVDVAVQRCAFTQGHTPYEVLITTPAFDDDELGAGAASLQLAERTIEITVAIDPNSLGWVPALTAYVVPVDLAAYSFETIGVALPVGLMQIGPDRWLVVDQSSWRLAVIVEPPSSDRVRFVDESVPRSVDVVRRLLVLDGANELEALAVADLLNGPGLFE